MMAMCSGELELGSVTKLGGKLHEHATAFRALAKLAIINYDKNAKVGKKQTSSTLYRRYPQIERCRPHPNSYLFAPR